MTKLSAQQIAAERLDGWALLVSGLHTRIRTEDFATGLALVRAIGAAAERMNHHPDLDLRYTHLDVRLISHDVRAVTERDVRLARTVSDLAARAGARLQARTATRLELALDTPDAARVLPFWRAVLGFEEVPGPGQDSPGELHDESGTLPAIWFQQSGGTEPRQRWHPDLWVDPAEVQPRIEAALAAGGKLVDESYAPAFWVLADPDGNRMCLCTTQR